MEDLIELQDRDCLWPRRTFPLHQLFRIKRLAHENVQDFAGARDAITGDLCIVDIELRFAVAPVTVVLQQGGRELREGPSDKKYGKHDQQRGFEHQAINYGISSECRDLGIPPLLAKAKELNIGGPPTVPLRRRVGGWMFLRMGSCDHEREAESSRTGIANPAVIDLFALDHKTDEILLVMHESRPWDHSDD